MPETLNDCLLKNSCSGCDFWGLPWDQQIEQKILALKTLWNSEHSSSFPEQIEKIRLKSFGLRDRVDLQLRFSQLGLFHKNGTDLVDIESCGQLSPALQSWLTDFRKIHVSWPRASFRLRVAPDGTRGLWIDLPNTDIRDLLKDNVQLIKLSEAGLVEIGQKRKRLVLEKGQFRLSKEAGLFPWTYTLYDKTRIQLHHSIADFTQPGHLINEVLVQKVTEMLAECQGTIVDWGCGIGNLSVPLLQKKCEVIAIDWSPLELSWEHTLRQLNPPPTENSRLSFVREDFFNKDLSLSSNPKIQLALKASTWVVDPSRPGAGKLFAKIPNLVEKILLVSCSHQGLAQDSRALKSQGFHLKKLCLLEMFPQSKSPEWISVWTKTKADASIDA